SEAFVIAEGLQVLGVAPTRLVLDEGSCDTLQTAIAAHLHMRAQGLNGCLVCTESYHVGRARALMQVLGERAVGWPAPARLRQMGRRNWVWMRARELLATPYDVVLAAMKRPGLRRLSGPASP
ncbi:MAG TPA: ElyC/SanA/YdcF family protein, partial [Phenylobacterium sp.]